MIFEVVAALKLANDAISTIKTSMGHVHSIKDLAKPLTQLADAKETIKERADKGDLDAFIELKQIQDQEEALKRMMIWELNRGDLWTEYQTFLKTRKTLRDNQRKRAEAKKLAKRKAIKTGLTAVAIGAVILTAVGGAIAMVYWMVSLRGK